jgi:hypothetical protein
MSKVGVTINPFLLQTTLATPGLLCWRDLSACHRLTGQRDTFA